MTNLSDYSFVTRHQIYRNLCLIFLGEPTTVPISRAILAGLTHESQNFRRFHHQTHLSSILASISLLVATTFCVLVWQKTTLPTPAIIQGNAPAASASAIFAASHSSTINLASASTLLK